MSKLYKFSYYYKYTFTFTADDGEQIEAGGGAEDIYRASVMPEMTLEEIKSEFGEDCMKVYPPVQE